MDEDAPSEITVLTLNVWGLLAISKQRTERLVEIGRHIAQREPLPHIVALQECFVQADYEAIRRETRFALPHGKYYRSGAFGSGLVILSRWPIEQSWHYEYPLGGRPSAVTQGDWYVGKGIAAIRTRMGRTGEWVEVFNTHTQAPYPHDPYVVHRLSQSWQIAQHLHTATLRPGSLVLALGDFNMKPCSLQHKIVTARAPAMRDTWRVLHPDSSLGCVTDAAERARRRPVPTVEYNILENGCTSNNATNTWRWTARQRNLLGKKGADPSETHVAGDAPDERGHRLDYVFANVAGAEREGEWEEAETARPPPNGAGVSGTYPLEKCGTGAARLVNGKNASSRETETAGSGDKDRDPKPSSRRATKRGVHFQDHPAAEFGSPAAAAEELARPVWVIRSARVAVMERHLSLGCSLSDHYGYEVTLVQRTPKRHIPSPPASCNMPIEPVSAGPPSAMKKGTGRRPQTPPHPLAKESAAAHGGGDGRERGRRGTYLDSPTASERRASTESTLLAHSKFSPGECDDGNDEDSTPLTDPQYDEILSLVRTYAVARAHEQRYRYVHAAAALAATFGFLAAVWWVPSYGGFVLLLVGMINFAAGVLDGLYALLFLGRERRYLVEFEWDVCNARSKERGGRLEMEASVGVVGGG